MSASVDGKRNTGVDLVKAAAILFVAIIHSTSPVLWEPAGSFPWLCGLFWGSVTRSAVPLFFMCTGVLFLSPQKPFSVKKLYTRSIPRILAALFVWAMVYKIWRLFITDTFSAANLWYSFKRVLLFDHEFHFYFLYIILMIYVLLPILRLITDHATKKQLLYILAVWFAVGIVYPTVSAFYPVSLFSGIMGWYTVKLTYASAGFVLLGYYLYSYPPKLRISVLLYAVGTAIAFAGTWILSVRDGALNETFLQGTSVGVCFAAAGAFGIFMKSGEKLKGVPAKAVTFLSKASFCVYLVHIIFLEDTKMYIITPTAFAPIVSIPLIALGVLAASLAVYLILSFIPVINRWLI